MSRKKKQHKATQPRPPVPAAPQAATTTDAGLPAPLRFLNADYSAVLRMRNVRWLIVIAAVVAALWFGAALSDVFVPLLVALAIAYILNPLVAGLQKRGSSRTRAVLLIFASFVVVGLAVGGWFAAAVNRDVREMSGEFGRLLNGIESSQAEWIASWNESVPAQLQVDPAAVNAQTVINAVRDQVLPQDADTETPEAASARASMVSARAALLATFQRLDANNDLLLQPSELSESEFAAMDSNADGAVTTKEWFVYFGATAPKVDSRSLSAGAADTTEGVVSLVQSTAGKFFTLLIWLMLIPIYTWYFMIGFDSVVAGVREYLPGSHRPRIERLLGQIDAMLKAFFRGRIIVMLIVMMATTILFLAFGVPYAVLLGVLTGLGVLIPYVSIIAGWLPALALMAINQDSAGAIIGMSVIFHAIQALEQYVLTPRLLGNAVELHPVTLLVGVFVMASLFGLFGALLAVPLTALAKTLGREFLLPYFKSIAQEAPAAT